MGAIISIIIAYLIGSLSTAILLARFLGFPDPRTMGSKNAGATNVLRLIGKKEAAIVLVADGLKGLIAVLIGRLFGVEGFALGLVALASVVGHVFPVYFQFKGGRGVATAIGSIFGLSFITGFLVFLIWGGVAYFTRYSSLASLTSIAASVLLIPIFGQAAYFLPVLLIAALIFWKHKDNILRLKSGTETKFSL